VNKAHPAKGYNFTRYLICSKP